MTCGLLQPRVCVCCVCIQYLLRSVGCCRIGSEFSALTEHFWRCPQRVGLTRPSKGCVRVKTF